MTLVSARVGGRRVVVTRPGGTTAGAIAVGLASALATAREAGAAACVLPPAAMRNDPMWALTPADLPLVTPTGVAGAWLRSRWRVHEAFAHGGEWLRDWSASFWRELHRELRRQAGDERLPIDLRGKLREAARRSLNRSAGADAARVLRFPRRLLRERVAMRCPPELSVETRRAAAGIGLDLGARIVALETRGPVEGFFDLVDDLVARDWVVVRVGAAADPVRRPGLVDATGDERRRLLEVGTLIACRFLVCESPELQRTAYLTGTPSVLLNGTDPFSAYPVRADGLFTLATPVDLDTGRTLGVEETLVESFYRNLRNCGFRRGPVADAIAAVHEMAERLGGAWAETDAQSGFRARVVAAGESLAPRVRHVAKWGPDRGFIGDGCLARVQAERV